ncbi:hypothetical protein SAMD00019534_094530 [Acytostelium subglobosum LB1]|uniref:hypothetical protein n=1 Tax=Acytostelium subglobosum LB1 TaxID=1410327 RepID=UPI000644D593|nr:hypothetical protein SAMD00019534_094530 [Acytostelium subglobosum LB1]GAM26278.1 hypothetical protein SAMD00019534_094530 [Acytostelium subglobosum LB1]|eukprot:XP_012750832.1 hypothetical protein SAMD00019534_094530 [Acytostelium subglobosum LB1]
MSTTTTTKSVLFNEFGDADKLYVGQVPIQLPKKGEVAVKVAAIGLNRAEVLYRTGKYLDRPASYPASLGYEAAGVVESVGEGVVNFKVGDRVAVLVNTQQSRHPSNKVHAVFPENSLVHIDEGQSNVEAASVWMAYLTAYFALVDISNLTAGQTIVITAASSSTGLAAIQLARALGATVIATSRTSTKKQRLLDFGAHHFIATGEEDVEQRILELTNGVGANLIYDPVGGPLVTKLVSAIALRGTFVLYGLLSPEPTPFPILQVMSKYINFKGYILFEFTTDEAALTRATTYLRQHFSKYQSIVGKVFKGIEATPAAHVYLDEKDLFGKVIVEF